MKSLPDTLCTVDNIYIFPKDKTELKMNILVLAYISHLQEQSFWNEVFHLVSCIPQNEIVVLAGDMDMLEVVMLAMM